LQGAWRWFGLCILSTRSWHGNMGRDANSEKGDGVYGIIIWIGSSNEEIHLASCNVLFLIITEMYIKFCIDSPDAEQLT
jgi:hypothetical protein